MAPRNCALCDTSRAILKRPKTGQQICKECFFYVFETEVHNTITAAQLSMASHGVYSVTLDEAIEAMRITAADMSVKYKETSLSVRYSILLYLPIF